MVTLEPIFCGFKSVEREMEMLLFTDLHLSDCVCFHKSIVTVAADLGWRVH